MPTPSGETVLSNRVPYADTVIQGRDSPLTMELVRDGVTVALAAAEKVQFIDRDGTVAFEQNNPPEAGGKVSTIVPGVTSLAFNVGELYQVRWLLKPDGEAVARWFRRPAVVSKFVLAPPITDFDLTVGVYPDLIDAFGDFATTGASGESTLQPYIDEAWNVILRKLFKVNRWPDLLFTVEDLVEPLREQAWERIFKFLFQRAGEGSKWETLWREHRDNARTEWNSLSARFDNDADGLPDTEKRDAVAGAIHPNAAPRRRLRGRW